MPPPKVGSYRWRIIVIDYKITRRDDLRPPSVQKRVNSQTFIFSDGIDSQIGIDEYFEYLALYGSVAAIQKFIAAREEEVRARSVLAAYANNPRSDGRTDTTRFLDDHEDSTTYADWQARVNSGEADVWFSEYMDMLSAYDRGGTDASGDSDFRPSSGNVTSGSDLLDVGTRVGDGSGRDYADSSSDVSHGGDIVRDWDVNSGRSGINTSEPVR